MHYILVHLGTLNKACKEINKYNEKHRIIYKVQLLISRCCLQSVLRSRILSFDNTHSDFSDGN